MKTYLDELKSFINKGESNFTEIGLLAEIRDELRTGRQGG